MNDTLTAPGEARMDAYEKELCMDCGTENDIHHHNCATHERGDGGKQARYQDSQGDDWIDEFARSSTPEEFRGAMRFTIGKYVRRVGRKNAELSEVRKMRDYCQRWEEYLVRMEGEA